ncbi:MAG: glycoside hydrolase [Bacteroides sp.]|nr:glycoside hydrolase [Bacteroides sp.]MCM1413007.1 glycoside hydrolase [Bacteroides sp.]MCM1471713.1 glycoside hydrolase [Bacteroides sp.]
MKLTRLLLAALLAVGATATAQNVGYSNPVDSTYRSLVFNKGDFDSQYYRIPALLTLPDGTIVAVADKRINSLADLPGDIDVVCRRSTDGGRTWSDYITVAEHDDFGGYGDPAIVRDRRTGDLLVISLNGCGLWSDRPGHISVSRSTDGGLSWQAPVNISPQILTDDSTGVQPIKCVAAFATSGRALQLKNGRIMFVLVTRKPGVEGFPCYAIYSDDGGRKWKVSKTPAILNGDESKIEQLPDGTLLMSIRNRFSGNRKFSISKDNGVTWTEQPIDFTNLHDVACNGDLLNVNYNGKNYLLQSLPAGPWRDNITIYASEDGGHTWPYSLRVSPGPGAYSAMTQLADGSIGIMTEEGVHNVDARHSQGYRIWFTRIPLANLLP